MSAQLTQVQFEDKEFVKAYFRDAEDGNAVTKRLVKDGVTLNSPDLIARLVKWLQEAEPSDESSADATARAEQELNAMKLKSREEEEKKEQEEDKTPSGSDKAGTPGGSSSDGTTRLGAPTSSPSSTTSTQKPGGGGK